jgi:superfamily I DNA and/or RNA helicase
MPTSTFKWVQEGKSRNLINVAITRAKKELIIVGNRNNINHRGGLLNELSDWVDYCSEME